MGSSSSCRSGGGGVGKRSLGSTMREDDADDIEDEDECVLLSKLGDGKGRRKRLVVEGSGAVSISIKWGFAS